MFGFPETFDYLIELFKDFNIFQIIDRLLSSCCLAHAFNVWFCRQMDYFKVRVSQALEPPRPTPPTPPAPPA